MFILFMKVLTNLVMIGYGDYHNSNENIRQISNNDIKNTIEIADKYDIIFVVVGDEG